MKQVFVDANVFLRFFCRGAVGRSYRLSHGKIVDVLKAIQAQAGLSLVDASTVSAAITLSETTGVGFADAYIATSADAHACDGTATFNVRDFVRLNAPMVEF